MLHPQPTPQPTSAQASATAVYTDRAAQLRGMISFATRCEKAYRATGQTENADQAKAHRERCEAELKAVQS
jgi:hypothetical protein